MKINGTINTATDTYLITFQNSGANKFITHYDEIQNVLKELKNGYYLQDIYRFNPSKMKFEKVAKSQYKTLFSWNTEAIELLKQFNILK